MKPIKFKNAYYIKLGEGGKWAESSIEEGKIRVGWAQLTLEEINNWREELNRKIIREYREQIGLSISKGAVSNNINRLRKIVTSTPDDVWITFHASHLWWCQVAESDIEEDKISKYRKVLHKWSNQNIQGNPLIITQISGRLSKMQRYSGTACNVGEKERKDLTRLINNQPSEEFLAISKAKSALAKKVGEGLALLHWKDFETLVDLIFRNTGWRRISMVGSTMKYVDMELEEPITGDLYQVQVKSKATSADLKEYAEKFSQSSFKTLYFVVHDSQEKWAGSPKYKNVELILQERLANMVVELGLIEWLLRKVK